MTTVDEYVRMRRLETLRNRRALIAHRRVQELACDRLRQIVERALEQEKRQGPPTILSEMPERAQ